MYSVPRIAAPGLPWPAVAVPHCLRCGAAGLSEAPAAGEERARPTCARCGAVFYFNVKAVVGTFPVTDGRVLLVRRGIPPRAGTWSYAGGFLELGETVEAGALRETHEETGFDVALERCLGVFSRPEAGVVVILYQARIVGGDERACPEVLELGRFAPDAIPWADLAFQTTRWGLEAWLRARD